MGNHLHGFAEKVAFSLPLDHGVVNLPRCRIRRARKRRVGEAVIMAQIEIGFAAVVGNIDLAMLKWVHGPRIDVEIGIEFEHGDL